MLLSFDSWPWSVNIFNISFRLGIGRSRLSRRTTQFCLFEFLKFWLWQENFSRLTSEFWVLVADGWFFWISKLGIQKQRLAMLSYILCPVWSIFTPVDILTIFDYFCWSGAIDVVKSLWSSSLECSGTLVTKPFPWGCCGVAAVSKRLLKLSSF